MIDDLAVVVSAAGLLCGVLAFVRTRDAWCGVRVLLDLLLAAGLLRLAATSGWSQLAAAAALVAVRRLLTIALREAPGASRNG
ncbi:MAG TPA: hypothetical protein VKP64_13545 [Mycobacteriales bacterium]|nr:hypothetical protein [Mycobacteriales bacterium]